MSEKIKTSEEIREELADKKVAKTYLAEFENGIKNQLNSFLNQISDFKPDFKVTHNITLSEELKAQKIALNEVTERLNKLSIPERIEVLQKKETKITFSDKTTQFLFWFCSICFVVAVAGAVYGINAYDKIDALKNEEYKKGVLEGRKQIYYNLPKDSQKFIEKKYPEWRKIN
jgi:hypothetical protein